MSEKIALIYGTRPEFLKIYPVILEAKKRNLSHITINTGQHSNILTDMEQLFDFVPDYNLKVQNVNFTNAELLSELIKTIDKIVAQEEVDGVVAQGDTFTVLASAMVAFLGKRHFYHVEAGLRTDNINFPFPEEFNRRVVSLVSTFNFAPTTLSESNLLAENISQDQILITGNTIIDMLLYVLERYSIKLERKNQVFITAHRRENIGPNLASICDTLAELAAENANITFYWSLHPNPKVRQSIYDALADRKLENIVFLEPLNYVETVTLMAGALLLISDSGGIQEEAPTLQKRVLILREETERPEVLACGSGILVGSNKEKIKEEFYKELNHSGAEERFVNPFGSGQAAIKIIDCMTNSSSDL